MLITLESKVVASEGQMSADMDGESVILNLESGTYYGLDDVGAFVWQLIQKPAAVMTLRDQIMAEYSVDADRCAADLLQLLQKLAELGLIEPAG